MILTFFAFLSCQADLPKLQTHRREVRGFGSSGRRTTGSPGSSQGCARAGTRTSENGKSGLMIFLLSSYLDPFILAEIVETSGRTFSMFLTRACQSITRAFLTNLFAIKNAKIRARAYFEPL